MIRINGNSYNSTADQVASKTPGFEFGTYQMFDRPDIYEPQRTNNFEFIVTGLDTNGRLKKAGLISTDTSNSSYIENGAEIIRISLKQAFIPSFSQKSIQVQRGNTTINYAGVPSFDGGNIQLNDYIGANSYEVLAAWQNLSYNVATEKVGLAADYKKTCWVCEYTPDYQLVKKWKLYGCWISQLSCDNLNYDQNSIVGITAKITYDRAMIDYSDLD